MKRVLRVIAGTLLIPVFFGMYVFDRVLCLPLLWIGNDSLLSWFRDTSKMTNSFIRSLVGLVLIGLLWLFQII